MTDSSSSSFGADWLIGAVKKNPEGLLLLAAGCALLLRGGTTPTRPQRADTYRGARDNREGQWDGSGYNARGGRAGDHDGGLSGRVSRAADDAREYASEMGKTVSETAGQYASAVGDTTGRYASKVSDTAGRYASSVSDYADDARAAVVEQSGRLAQQAQGTVERIVREQPLAVAFAGLAAGAAVAAAFPATSIERRTLGPAGERLSEAAESAREKLGEATSAAGERLKDVAEQRGLNAEGLKNAARDVAGAFQESFAGEQKEAASSSGQNRVGSAAGGSTSSSGSSGSGGGTPRPGVGGSSSASGSSTSRSSGSGGGGSGNASGGSTSRSGQGTPSKFGSGSHSK
jgi:hypothetical protein